MNSQTLGGTLLVAGTSMGAGMLALPLVSAATGLWAGVVLMMLTGGMACYGGLLIAEACRAVPEADNLHGVVGRLLGRPGQFIASLSMMFLYFSLCAAYISAGAGQLLLFLEQQGIIIERWQGAMVVALVIAVLVVIGTIVVDYVNRIMFITMLALLFFIMLLLLPEVQIQNLNVAPTADSILLAALPVLYTSFGYHCAVPTVVKYVGGKPRYFRIALVAGSVLPLMVYVLWQLAINGTLSSSAINDLQLEKDTVEMLIRQTGEVSQFTGFNYIISIFTACAIGTSFLGVAIGLFDYFADVGKRSNSVCGRTQTVMMTLLLPLICAVFIPGSFITALGYAAVALVVQAVFIPVILVWEVRKEHLKESYQVAGGTPGLILVSLMGLLVIVAQVGIVSGLLPSIG